MHAAARRSAALAVALLLGAGCAPGASSPAVTAPATAILGTVSTPRPTPTPVAAADLDHPVGLIAIGHSGLTGEGTAGQFEPGYTASWATGTLPAVNSIYLRMVAAIPATEGHLANTAVNGAEASTLASQAQQALNNVPAPALAIIQTVDNDIRCDGSNVAAVGQSLAEALTVIRQASPHTKILVVGQLGRPNIEYIRMLVAREPTAKLFLTWDDECSFFDGGGVLREESVKQLSNVIDSYEAENARVCAEVANCSTDGGFRKTWTDRIEYFSPDWTHFNVSGQKAEAEFTWPVVKEILGL